jgi:hypothetical protein
LGLASHIPQTTLRPPARHLQGDARNANKAALSVSNELKILQEPGLGALQIARISSLFRRTGPHRSGENVPRTPFFIRVVLAAGQAIHERAIRFESTWSLKLSELHQESSPRANLHPPRLHPGRCVSITRGSIQMYSITHMSITHMLTCSRWRESRLLRLYNLRPS